VGTGSDRIGVPVLEGLLRVSRSVIAAFRRVLDALGVEIEPVTLSGLETATFLGGMIGAHELATGPFGSRTRSLVATRQRGEGDRRARREQADADVGLDGGVERLDEQEPPADPDLVPIEAAADLGLREPIVTVERTDQPRLLELGEPAALVQLREPHLTPIVVFAERDHIETLDGFKRLRAARVLARRGSRGS
jgi:hypothetical protein